VNKTESIARKILGWKLNRWDRWYDAEHGIFIPVSDFQPEKNLEDALLIVERLKSIGFAYSYKEDFQVCFNDFCETGNTLAQAITNAAYLIADSSSISDEWL
jgi:hypothetical protein